MPTRKPSEYADDAIRPLKGTPGERLIIRGIVQNAVWDAMSNVVEDLEKAGVPEDVLVKFQALLEGN